MSATDRTQRTAALLSVGDELVLGQIRDSNAGWLAARLADLGITVREMAVVSDDLGVHTQALRRLAAVADVVISTGGLGPTADDLTRDALAAASGDTLVEDEAALATIAAFFTSRGREMPPINRVQALRPARGEALANANGTAPGLFARVEGTPVYCLPGPPGEMIPMFESLVVARLRPDPTRIVRTLAIGLCGIGESDAATRLGPLMSRTASPLVGTTASGGIVTCRIRAECATPVEAERAVALARDEIMARFGPHVFAVGHNDLARAVVEEQIKAGRTVGCVESCTGGLLGAALTQTPGSSAAFVGGLLTYTNELKVRLAGVPEALFKSEGRTSAPGAVSREVAAAMAAGGRERLGASSCLAVTGIAGPEGAEPGKPVGTVWIALADERGIDVRRFAFSGERGAVRSWSVTSALAMLWMRSRGAEVKLLRQVE